MAGPLGCWLMWAAAWLALLGLFGVSARRVLGPARDLDHSRISALAAVATGGLMVAALAGSEGSLATFSYLAFGISAMWLLWIGIQVTRGQSDLR
jgi:hypothetical protein